MSSYRPLHDGWTVTAAGGAAVAPGSDAPLPTDPVPATVPGCVHTDLLAAGLIPDPYLDDNERRLEWVGRTDWRYQTSFTWQPGEAEDQVDLVCAGLDTVADLELNGQQLGSTANMHRSYRFPVRAALRPGENQLVVHFSSAHRYAERMRDALGDRPGAYPAPFQFIRKMACNFGWDWGPSLVTAGIWRPVGLHTWRTARLAEVRPQVGLDGAEGRVDLHLRVTRQAADAGVPLAVTAEIGAVRGHVVLAAGQDATTITLAVREPARWWPRGYGDQPRYDVSVRLHTPDGRQLDHWHRRIGFRSVRLDTAPDAHGAPFTLVVNGVPIFARGVNWIPDDAFPSRVDRQRYADRLDQACAANVNLLRVWGGGIYEPEAFYDLCDERGLLVAQDFLFACAAYPEEPPFPAEIAAEARENVVRLASHPSLVLWHGNNENIWGWHDWGWQSELDGRSWGDGYYFGLLPRVVAELDPQRPYWAGSPYSGSRDIHPNDPARGSVHIWDLWNQIGDYTHYRSYRPRFVAEFGWQGPAAYATLRRAMPDAPLASDSPGMRHRQRAIDGDLKLRRGLDAHLPPPRDFDDWHFLAQLNQARAVSTAVEHFRSLRPLCMGAVVWQLNDCWPVTSWAAIDGDGRRKPLWYALRHVFADRLLTVQPDGDGLALVAVNESAQAWSTSATITRLDLDGRPLGKTSLPLEVEPRSAERLPLPEQLATAESADSELLLAEAGPKRAWWFFVPEREVEFPPAEYGAVVARVPGGLQVSVTARTVLRDLILFADRADPAAEVDQALVTLLPGESTTFTVTTGASLDPAVLTTPPVLRCLNDIPNDTPAGR